MKRNVVDRVSAVDAALAADDADDAVRRVWELAASHPDDIAVTNTASGMTYAGLAAAASSVARQLSGPGGSRRGEVIAILAARGPSLVAAVSGSFAAGAAYLPLDGMSPPARNAALVSDAGARVLLAEPGQLQLARQIAAALDDPVEILTLGGEDSELFVPAGRQDDLAYVIFTSGSTGRPKGAMVTQRGLRNHLMAMLEELGLSAADRVGATDRASNVRHLGLAIAGPSAGRRPGRCHVRRHRERST